MSSKSLSSPSICLHSLSPLNDDAWIIILSPGGATGQQVRALPSSRRCAPLQLSVSRPARQHVIAVKLVSSATRSRRRQGCMAALSLLAKEHLYSLAHCIADQIAATVTVAIHSRVPSLYVVVRLSSVCLSSVTFVHPTQAIEIFGNVFTPFGTLDIY